MLALEETVKWMARTFLAVAANLVALAINSLAMAANLVALADNFPAVAANLVALAITSPAVAINLVAVVGASEAPHGSSQSPADEMAGNHSPPTCPTCPFRVNHHRHIPWQRFTAPLSSSVASNKLLNLPGSPILRYP